MRAHSYGIRRLLLETPTLLNGGSFHLMRLTLETRPFLTGEPLSHIQYPLGAKHNSHEEFIES